MSKARTLSNFISSGSPLADGTISVSEVSGAAPSNSPSFTGNITVSGTVDGRDIAADGTKLDGIEAGATADQTASEIKTAYESNANTNAFTDAEQSKLAGIEAGATADQTKADIDALGIAASTAATLATARNIALTGDVTGSANFDGSANISITATVANNSHTHTPSNITNLIEGTTFSGTYPVLFGVDHTTGRIFENSNITFNGTSNVLSINGGTAWHSGNDGAGSGLDADLLDGLNSTSFIRSDANDTGTGGYSTSGTYWEVGNGTGSVAINTNDGKGNANLTFNHNGGVPDITGNAFRIETNVDSATGAKMYFEGKSGATGGVSTDLNDWMTLSDSGATVLGQTVWTAGNDGAGSGLDADTLDGVQGSSFLRSDQSDTINGSLTITTGTGTGTFGSSNTSWFHMSTDRPSFYMNKGLKAAGDVGVYGQNTYLSSDDMYLNGVIYHYGDTDTYMQFHALNQWRVVVAGTERLEVNTGGINVNGAIVATGNVTAYSDERLKSNIKTIDNALDKVQNLRGVTYDKDGKAGLGVIAQEVQKVLPEVVQEGEEYLSVAYGNIVGVLIEAIKEQQKQIDELKAKLDV